jgi:hypothetical protein
MTVCCDRSIAVDSHIYIGEHAATEGATEGFFKDEAGVTSASVPQAGEAGVSVSFVPSSLQHAEERMCVIVDFRLTLDDATRL